MKRLSRPTLAVVLAAVAAWTPEFVLAKFSEGSFGVQASTPRSSTSSAPTLADVEAELAALEADRSIEESQKGVLRQQYEQVIEALRAAAEFETLAREYRLAIETGPERTAERRAELQDVESVEEAAAVEVSGGLEELQSRLELRRARLTLLRAELAEVASEAARAEGRPLEISARLVELQRELSAIREQLTSAELEKIVQEIISELSTTSPKDLGKVMKMAMARIAGKADGKAVNEIARRLLS